MRAAIAGSHQILEDQPQEEDSGIADALAGSKLEDASEVKANGPSSSPEGAALAKSNSISVALTTKAGSIAVAMTCNGDAS